MRCYFISVYCLINIEADTIPLCVYSHQRVCVWGGGGGGDGGSGKAGWRRGKEGGSGKGG